MKAVRHELNVVIYEAPDLPGQWIAHCLELDIVSQGNTSQHAMEMIVEAVQLVADQNVSAGKPAFEFRSAPPEDWSRLDGTEEIAVRMMRIRAPITENVTITPHVRAG